MGDQVFQFICESHEAGRLDKFLVVHMPEFSRARLQGLIADGFVLVNGRPAGKSGQMIEAGMEIDVALPPVQPTDLTAENIPLDILFENDDLMVVNKPAGMVVHPSAGHGSGTLVNAALAHDPELEGIGGDQRPGIVHRLDKDTSGLILIAKNDRTHRWLVDQFRQREVKKVYLALVDGHPPTPTGRIEAPIGRDLQKRKQMAVVPLEKGREAVSEYRVLESFPSHTLLEVHPHTGRTHQIRVHLAFLGCPIAGDTLYGRKKASLGLRRQFLHAFRLTVVLPGEKKPRSFEAALPDDLSGVLDILRKGH
ncbi:MAG: RluA family pseudouridine synthase [Anaerolineae bacterium]|nr:RluA family pseudouridine synthase [Anaerolineae bacterium]